jgi:Zn-dependent protease with chaperone function
MDIMTPISAASCFATPLIEVRTFLTIISISFAVFSFVLLKKSGLSPNGRLGLIFAHLAGLAFPPILLATHFGCMAMCLSCATSLTGLLALVLPFTVGATALAGLFVMPAFFIGINRARKAGGWMPAFVSEHARRLGISAPPVYLLDRAKPVAFSFRTWRSAIFMSVGLSEILSKRELQAVILHEFGHIANKASFLKVSDMLLRLSPFSLLKQFNSADDKEERRADAFAAKAQGTSRWLKSAKRKMTDYGDSMDPKKEPKKPCCC